VKLSIVIPVLNESRHLPACLAALASQPLDPERHEVLAVDNGSTDGSLELLERTPFVRVLRESRRDAYLARNRAIEEARGEVIAFTDADCAVAPGWLSRLQERFQHAAVDVVVGRLAYPAAASRWLQLYADYYDTKTRWLFEGRVDDCLYGHGGNMAVRAEVFARLGLFAPSPVVGDTEILHRLLTASAGGRRPGILYVDDLVATHLEVETLADLLPKLRAYGGYASAVSSMSRYRPLTFGERLHVLRRCIRDNRYGPSRAAALAGVLAVGLVSFELGRRRAARSSAADLRDRR
jgi:glycosyltransferase involved in cell wall biosynthesis